MKLIANDNNQPRSIVMSVDTDKRYKEKTSRSEGGRLDVLYFVH